jgi:hypothetical protein
MDADLDGAVGRDFLLVVGVGLLLVAVHYLLGPNAQTAPAFDHHEPWSHTLLTSAYVHTDARHLWSNGGGYVSVGVLAAFLCHWPGGRDGSGGRSPRCWSRSRCSSR